MHPTALLTPLPVRLFLWNMNKLLLAILLLFLPVAGWGADRYVDATSGVDSGDGGQGSPWATLAYVEANASASDTVYLKYGETWTEEFNPLAGMTVSAYGASGDGLPIIDAENTRNYCIEVDATISGVTIEYVDMRNATTGLRSYADNLTVRYCDIHDHVNYGFFQTTSVGNTDVIGLSFSDNTVYNNGENAAYGNVYLRALDGHQITSPVVNDNTIYNSSDDAGTAEKGITFYNSGQTTALITGGTINGNTISDIEGRAIECATDVTLVEIKDNIISDCYIGVHLGGTAEAVTNVTATGNSVTGDGDCTGVDCVAYFFDNNCENNTFEKNQWSDISIGIKVNDDGGGNLAVSNQGTSIDYGAVVKDADTVNLDSLYHNTFVVSGGSGTGIYTQGSTETYNIKNNIIVTSNSASCGWDESAPATGAPINDNNTTYGFDTAFCEGLAGVNAINVDPQITSDYAPQNQTLFCAGEKITGAETDYNGNLRGECWTIGAIENFVAKPVSIGGRSFKNIPLRDKFFFALNMQSDMSMDAGTGGSFPEAQLSFAFVDGAGIDFKDTGGIAFKDY